MTADIRLDVTPDDLELKTRYSEVIGALDLLACTTANTTHGWWQIDIHLTDATLTATPAIQPVKGLLAAVHGKSGHRDQP